MLWTMDWDSPLPWDGSHGKDIVANLIAKMLQQSVLGKIVISLKGHFVALNGSEYAYMHSQQPLNHIFFNLCLCFLHYRYTLK